MRVRIATVPAFAVLAIVVLHCGTARAFPPTPGLQAGRPVGIAANVTKAQEASLFCGLGTPVIGGVASEGACEAGGEVAGKLAGEAISTAGSGVMDSLTEWMIGAARTITGFVSKEMRASTTPQLGALWYREDFSRQADLGAALGLLVSLIALTSAAIRRDPRALAATLMGILRAGIGTGLVLALTTIALEVADQISAAVLSAAPHSFWSTASHAWGTSGFGGFESSALAMLIALVEVLCGLGVWLELIVRNAAIYVAVLFFPVALAASIWPALDAWTNRLARILQLLVSFKPVAIIVLTFAGSAATAGLRFSGEISGSVGTILAAIVIFALAAFTPWVLTYLLAADAESAQAAMGVRAAAGGAVAGSQPQSLRNIARSGARAGGGGGGRGSRPGGSGPGLGPGNGGGPGGSGDGGSRSSGGPVGGGGGSGDDALQVAGAAIGSGNVGAAAGVDTQARAPNASPPQRSTETSSPSTSETTGAAAHGLPSSPVAATARATMSPRGEREPATESDHSLAANATTASPDPSGSEYQQTSGSGALTEQKGTVVDLRTSAAGQTVRRDSRSRRPVKPSRPESGASDG